MDAIHNALTMSEWKKTQEYRAICSASYPHNLFVIEGIPRQGFKGTHVDVRPTQWTREELELARDVDGSKHRVSQFMASRKESNAMSKERELSERRMHRAQQELAVLQLEEMKGKMGKLPEDVVAKAKALIEEAEAPLPPEVAEPVICLECQTHSPAGHKHPDRWLRGHMAGKHRRGLKNEDRGSA